MLRVIHSIPDECPDCGSLNLSGKEAMLLFESGNTVLCNSCGIIMVLHDSEEDDVEEQDESADVVASFVVCPHCKTANEIQIAEGEEWCSGCGLDPNETDYEPLELAHLWRQGSGIRDSMERGQPKKTSRMYRFLTNFCGPHCSLADNCPQSTKNFAVCFREEVIESDDPDLLKAQETPVGKRKQKKEQKRLRKLEAARIAKENARAVVAYASSGWYERNAKQYENQDPQEPAHTGSGSGT